MNAKLFSISLLAAGVLLASASQANASGYTFTDLGTLPEGSLSGANGINDSGQVAGWSDGPIMSDSLYELRPSRATIWNGTTPTELGGSSIWGSRATGINDSGQVVGAISYGKGGVYAFIWNGTTPTELRGDSATGINDSGQVVGYSDYNAFIWNGTTPTDLGMGGPYSSANGINNSGQVVGEYQYPDGRLHAVIWNGTTPTDLGYGSAIGINDSGQVVGYSETPDGRFYATIWNGTTPTDLGTLGGSYSEANGINDSGQVVGSSYTFGNSAVHATIWNGTAPTDLNSFLSLSEVTEGWVLKTANDINDNGWIVGDAHNSITGVDRAFLLTPCEICPITQVPEQPITQVPEPETYAMFMAGLGLMGFIARRRKNGQA